MLWHTCEGGLDADGRSRNPYRVSATVIVAAQAAGLHSTIMGLPQLYRTIISPYPVAQVMNGGSEECAAPAQSSEQGPTPGIDQEDACEEKAPEPSDVRHSTEDVGTKFAGVQALQDLPPPHVPNAAELELLAIARKNYLTLRAQKRSRRLTGVWNTQYAQRPLGAVPDFSTAHAAVLEQRCAFWPLFLFRVFSVCFGGASRFGTLFSCSGEQSFV